MCGVCGCSGDGEKNVRVRGVEAQNRDHAHDHDPHAHDHDHGHDHHHEHDHGHHHAHPHPHSHAHEAPGNRRIQLEENLLRKNDLLAERNRGWLAGRDLTAINLVSSPGSGKTTLLERTLERLLPDLDCAVIEGDQESEQDARRIRATGCPAVQINTGAGCHLEADMVARALEQLQPRAGSVVFIENVGNLVCPALFDLGERARVALISVTEGEDKPLKYPHMIRSADLLLLTKTDLLPHLDFDIDQCEAWARQVNPDLQILRVSARDGTGMAQWLQWLERLRQAGNRLAGGGDQALRDQAISA